MSVSDLGGIHVPPGVSAWIDRVMVVLVGLLILWVVLKVIGYVMRRSYNLTPVATASSKDIKPDFLKVDRAAQKQMIERGREFDRASPQVVTRALGVTSFGLIASGVVSFVSAAFLAFGRIEELDSTWRNLSAKDRFVAIVVSHPVGFGIALAIIVAALARLMMSLRRAK
jgi:hypothetical protein